MDQNELQRIIRHNQKIGNRDIRTGTHYIWRTRKDNKVRSSHSDREGKIFSWKNPPPGGHPGEAFGCRCWPEPAEIDKKEFEDKLFLYNNRKSANLDDGSEIGDVFTDPKNLSLSNKGAEHITSSEDLRLKVYDDGLGNPTIGYGHKLKKGEHEKFKDGITKEQALGLYHKDTSWAQDDIRKHVMVPLTQNQFDALTSLVFNTGGGDTFLKSRMLQKLNKGDYDGAAEEILGFVYGTVKNPDGSKRKVKLDGLVKRRREEYELFKRH